MSGIELRTEDPTPVLAAPEGWWIDPISRRRLEATLASSSADVVGVVATTTDRVSGSSFRVTSERAAMHSTSGPVELDGTEAHGAVLLRSGVTAAVDGQSVRIPRGRLLVDPGATSHDPWAPIGPLHDASPLGRPPFPWRPVVLFLGFADDPDLADWVRRTSNGLVRRATEARIAVPAPTPGLHLTTPCQPTRASVTALVPDVVVALDPAALEAAPEWLGRDRSGLVIELTQDTTDEVHLVSWRIGVNRGRLRARIGRGLGPEALERLVRRLCAGPQALPPVEGRALWVRSPRPRRPSAATAATVAVLSGAGAADRARGAGFADHLGATVEVVGRPDGPAATEADVLLLRGVSHLDGVRDLVAARRTAGRHTVVDVGPTDLRTGLDESPWQPLPTEATVQLATAAGHATTTSAAVRDALFTRGVRALVLPHLVTRSRAAELRRLRDARPVDGAPVLGWHTASSPSSGSAEAIATVARDLLASLPQLRVEVVGDNIDAAREVLGDQRVAEIPGDPSPERLAGWTAQIWGGAGRSALEHSNHSAVVHAHLMGVPSLAWSGTPPVREGLVPAALTIGPTPADGWRRVESILTDEAARRRLSQQVIQVAEALYGPDAAASATSRFLGWVLRGP